ncbi:MAG: GH92 family glycosyl hydrolase [Bacteroidales bacterium]|nr:GH92 family glycosyl hydrolase [Bacteroidales bacterium]MBN2634089.1 GH92 family glycosyl hydrolase [Bacteroidales bacterium]
MQKHKILLAGIFIILGLYSCRQNSLSDSERLTAYVNPFIGTGYHGHTFPGAAFPFGQIQLSPDNGTQGWDWCSGYHYSDSVLAGFSHLHLSGTGIGDLADISFLPVNEKVVFRDNEKNAAFVSRYAGRYSHKDEKAEAGYYSVILKNNGVRAELAVTERVGFHRYTFPEGGEKNLIINLGFAINWDKPYKTVVTLADSCLITGMRLSTGWAKDQHVYFAARLSQPVVSSQITTVGGEGRTVGVFGFEKTELLVKTAISSVSVENALLNLDQSVSHWDFDAVKNAASDAWERELTRIRISTPDRDRKTVFYTALYHTMIAPALFSDTNGEFKGVNGDVRSARNYNRYTIFSLWDTYRALHPLMTFIQPERVNDMIKSMLDHYEQTGLLPVWELQGNETFCMVGNHSIPVISEAILKDIGDFDRQLALEAMIVTSMYDRDGMGLYDSLGYMPADLVAQSVAKSQEIAIDDWCLSAALSKLDYSSEADYFLNRSKNYRNYFDGETGFMRGKLSTGEWTTPFDPAYSKHEGSDYTEGNAWQYLWLAPHDVEGLIDLLGGKEAFADKLEQLFSVEVGVKGEEASADISGLIGAYAHGNEPGHHTTFLFNYAGRPWRTQELNRQIQKTMYTNAPDGLCGNEDCGQMSAWYIFSSLGFYPVNTCDMRYQFGSPEFRKATIQLPDGKEFTVKAPKASPENKYILEAVLNGKVLNRTYITWKEILEGGTLEFMMSSSPRK